MAPTTIESGDPSVERLATWIRRIAVVVLVASLAAHWAGWGVPMG